MASRRTMLAAGAGITGGLVTAGCSTGSNATWAEPGSAMPGSGSKTSSAPKSAVRVTVTPAADAKAVSPVEPIVISAEGGTLQTVSVAAAGKAVAGALDSDQRTWRSSGALEYSKTYTVTIAAVDTAGVPNEQTCTFETIKPTGGTATVNFLANGFLALKNGQTYGVGQPIIVGFNKAVKDKAAAEKIMQVSTTPAVEGRWRWIDTKTAHWRPAEYWAAGTKITVKVNAFGVNLGGDVYGAANASVQFSIGQSRIAIADYNTHYMKCVINGAVVKNIPVSMGKNATTTTPQGKTVYYATNSGVHVILNKEATVRMSSSSYGVTNSKDPNFYDETIKLACRISNSGEYVHFADWQIEAHGHANISHGCINVGPADAQWFYDNFQIGDVVQVTNSPRQLDLTNGLGDWNVPWAQW
jgi:lipoprotein-anchoring transpeptidase ErfK/SrfK